MSTGTADGTTTKPTSTTNLHNLGGGLLLLAQPARLQLEPESRVSRELLPLHLDRELAKRLNWFNTKRRTEEPPGWAGPARQFVVRLLPALKGAPDSAKCDRRPLSGRYLDGRASDLPPRLARPPDFELQVIFALDLHGHVLEAGHADIPLPDTVSKVSG
jgi:hypothetical protein